MLNRYSTELEFNIAAARLTDLPLDRAYVLYAFKRGYGVYLTYSRMKPHKSDLVLGHRLAVILIVGILILQVG